ncbi:MAG: HNH endonuclease [Bacteroidetes bacterium]|nr:MAG: HNH endonuclease [Bacteroidota bacterium]
MRPINRGNWPVDKNGNNIELSPYGKAKPFLTDRIGDYCSYCERPGYYAALEVEHILPKSLPQYKHLEENWHNFLLGCKNCNPIKGIKVHPFEKIFLPDRDNTFFAIKILEGGLITINENLGEDDKTKIRNFIDLIGLDRRPGSPNYSNKDYRWRERKKVWDIAIRYLEKFENKNADIETIIDLAKGWGFWSVWMTVFKNQPDVINNLIKQFPGCCPKCFDQNLKPVPRNNH